MNKAAELSLMLMQRRREMRLILGDKYAEAATPFRAVLRGKAAESNLPMAKVALELAKELEHAGYDPNLMFCAFVEESEAEVAGVRQ